jgi:beta-N-acetylhexosaminidase
VTDLLREKLGFKGIIVTDALDMGAITSIYTSEQAAIAAIEAGIDVVLLPKTRKKLLRD